MSTNGADAQEEAFTGLVGKFGKPSSSKVEPLQNRMGAKFDSIEASWRLGDVSILFVGINGSLDNGFILIETPAGRAAQQQFIDKLQSPKPKM